MPRPRRPRIATAGSSGSIPRMPVMIATSANARERGVAIAGSSAVLPSRTRSWTTASACGTPRSSSIAAANRSGRHRRCAGRRRRPAARRTRAAGSRGCGRAPPRPRRTTTPRCRGSSGSARRRARSARRAGRARASTSSARRKLPSDFDIFWSPTVTRPLCTQYRAKASPAAVDWASSFSWCGKRRSSPPPWMSNSGPR